MKDNLLAFLLIVQMIGLIGLGVVQQLEVHKNSERISGLILRFSAAVEKRDVWVHKLNNRVKELEKQRNLERRLTDVEKQLRAYCAQGRSELCGMLGPVDR